MEPPDYDDDDPFGDEEGTALLSRADLVAAVGNAHDPQPFLVFLVGDSPGRMVRLEGQTVCGRGQSCDLRLGGDGVSRQHTRLVRADGVTWVEDMGSTNGTLVNGERITGRRELADGDKIQVGATCLLKFSLQDELDQRLQRGLRDAALRDPLTGVHNRRALIDRLEADLAYTVRHGQPYTVAMLDLDHFKQTNDRFGHLAGDHVLKTFAGLVMGQIRREDFFARFGGEEFAIGCRGTDLDAAGLILERIRSVTESHRFEYEGRVIPVAVSIGAAQCRGAETPTALLGAADGALYAAKHAGRNCVRLRLE